MGHSKPEYGPEIDYKGVKAPEWCSMTIYRWSAAAGQRTEFPVTVYFTEAVGTKWDKDAKTHKVNARWTKAPRQMLTKCTEAAGLREAFPDELGGQHSAEEMEGQSLSQTDEMSITHGSVDPRGDVSNVDWDLRDKCVSEIADILNADKEEHEIADMLREYESTRLMPFHELYITVLDKLAGDGIITKAKWKEYLKVHKRPEGR